MIWFDIVVIVILLWATFKGASKGLVTQLAWIIALVSCFAFAESFSLKLAPQIKSAFPQVEPPLDRWIAMFILYMGFAFVSFGLARVLRGWLEKAKFEDFDKHLGGVLGFVKGVIICMILTFFSVTLSDSMRDTVLQSKSGHAAAVIMQTLEPVMPKELPAIITNAMARLNHDDFHKDDLDGHHEGGIIDDILDLGRGQGSGAGNNGVADDTGGGFVDDLLNFGKGSGNDTTAGTSTTTNTQVNKNAGGVTLNDFIKQLPASVGNNIKSSALEAIKNSSPEQQQKLIDQLKASASGQVEDRTNQIGNVLQNFIGQTIGGSGASTSPFENENTFGFPDRNTGTAGNTNGNPNGNGGNTNSNLPVANYDQTINKFLASIGEIYSSRPEAQQSFINNITSKLDGVPSQVKATVLQDWYADLMPGQNDPDPNTGLRTRLEVRILRQLQAAGIPTTRLSSELQQRLDAATRQ